MTATRPGALPGDPPMVVPLTMDMTNSKATFTMPAANVTVTPEFSKDINFPGRNTIEEWWPGENIGKGL
jgi:hypothetical protein